MNPLYPFLIALQFLTRLPVRLAQAADERVIGRSLPYYPVVGLLLGMLLATLAWMLSDAPALLRAALVLGGWVLLTGALHLDGLADSADAWVGGLGNRERTLAIMKDPYCGPAAVVTLVVTLLIKFAAVHVLATNHWQALLFIPALARCTPPLLFLTTPYVRPGGLGAALAAHLPRAACMIAVGVTVVATLAIGTLAGFWALLASVGVFVLLRRAMCKRLGGMTGDTAGALIELTETAALVAAALIAS
ncbi:MAG: adenosylcobinamide-GDP ribazoletransferase [Gammaproteobacteria bacterium]|nr:adenosylcobinamide-GDP ribazoletransferase [Gammaproteobacteria bacterium]